MRNGLLIVTAAVATLLQASSVAAHPQGPRKDRVCLQECRHEYRACVAPAYAEARLCIGQCSDLVEAARRACAEDSESDACAAAREEASACLAPCREDLHGALDGCMETVRACREDCPDWEPAPPKDPECTRQCHIDLRLCRAEARLAGTGCAEPCLPFLEAVRDVCGENHHSDECRTARAEAHDCLRPCREEQAGANLACVRASRECVASCPEAENSTVRPGPRFRPRGPRHH